jgi:hypothetical protein
MRQAFAVLCLAITFVGCSSTDTSTPMAACNSLANAACNKASSCNTLGTTTVAQCITATEQAAGCSTFSCAAGTTYNSGAVNTCINDVNNASCPVTNPPASCSLSLFCQ